MKRWAGGLPTILFLFLLHSPVLSKSTADNHEPFTGTDSKIVSELDSTWNTTSSPFVKQPEALTLDIGNGNHGQIIFPLVLDSKNPISIQIQGRKVQQVLASNGTYKAELIGKYLVYRGEKNSILYRYDADKQSLREFVYLKDASALANNGNIIQWHFKGADLKLRNDGSVALTQTVNIKNEVRKISNNYMAERISWFLAKRRGAHVKPGNHTRTLFTIPKPEYIDGHGKTLTEGIQYEVTGAKLTLHLETNVKLAYPLWVDPTLKLRADVSADVIFDGNQVKIVGSTVASSGDFNGDGIDDVIIGSGNFAIPNLNEAAYIFFGTDSPVQQVIDVDTSADVTLQGPGVEGFGISVAFAGDFNGDGLDDVIIGAPSKNINEATKAGGVYIFFGKNTAGPLTLNAVTDANLIIDGSEVSYEYLGRFIDSAGDFNGDGLDDIILGHLYNDNNGLTNSGSAYVFLGRNPATQLILTIENDADITIDGRGEKYNFGQSVASAGDFNGDGLDDIIIGAASDDTGERDAGSAFIFFGQNFSPPISLNADTDADVIIDGQSKLGRLGYSVSSAGDFNGDGLDDVIVGTLSGNAFIFFGQNTAGQIRLTDDLDSNIVLGDSDGVSRFGSSVAPAGDFNGDGLDDILSGAYRQFNTDDVRSGNAYIFFGRSASNQIFLDPNSDADIVLYGQNNYDDFGIDVSSGDFNSDGLTDIFVAAPGSDHSGSFNSGSVYLFFSPYTSIADFRNGDSPDVNYIGAQDSYLMETRPSENFGTLDHILADGSEFDSTTGTTGAIASALQWDLSSLPAETIVDSATVTLNLIDTSVGNYYLYELKVPWNETTATWGNLIQSGSIGASPLGTILPGVNGENVIDLNTDGLALVQNWINGTVSNNGFLIVPSGSSDNIRFWSSEAANVEQRPKLTLSFTPPTLIKDTSPPVVTAPADIGPVEATAVETYVNLGTGTISDNVGVVSLTHDAPKVLNSVFSKFHVGTTVVTWTAMDAFGNIGTDTQTVIIQDTTPPNITAPADITAYSSGAPISLIIGTANANDITSIPSISSDAPATFPVGVTVVTWTATDASGNTSTATQDVTVILDTTSPVINAPADVTAEATGVTTTVAIGTATATDNVAVAFITNDAPTEFPLGVTVVTWTATDTSGNSSTATQNVTVQDTTAPVITLLGSNPVDVDEDASYTDAGATAADIVNGNLTSSIRVGGLPVDTSVVGSHVVTYDVTDSSGNSAHVERTVNVIAIPTTPAKDVVMNFSGSGVSINLNNNASTVALHGDTAETLTVADVDDNGQDDVIVSFPSGTGPDSSGGIYISRNEGPLTLLDSRTAEQMAAGDFDGNGQMDLLLGFGTDGLWARMNDTPAALLIDLPTVAVAAGDIDNNGLDDMVFSLSGIGTLSLINFTDVVFYDASVAETLAVVDVDNNGEEDVIASFSSGSASGTRIARNQNPLTLLDSRTANQITAGDFDGSGQQDLLLGFGTDGLWLRMNDASAFLLIGLPPVAMASGDIDDNGLDDMVLSFDAIGTFNLINFTDLIILDTNAATTLAVGNIDGN